MPVSAACLRWGWLGRALGVVVALGSVACGDAEPRPERWPSGGLGASAGVETEADTDAAAEGGAGDDTGASGGSPGTQTSGDVPEGSTGEPPASDSSGGDEPAVPMDFNLILRETVQACSGCGIWFDWQGVEEDKPGLSVTWSLDGAQTTSVYRHGVGPDGDAFGYFLLPEGAADPSQNRHSLLIKQSPARTGLFYADLSAIPVEATIEQATLHLHIHTDEGLANSDDQSVLEVWECPLRWSWDEATWTQAAAGVPWAQPGGDFGEFVREIRAWEDMHAVGYSKANPDAHFDFTDYVQQLQAEREAP